MRKTRIRTIKPSFWGSKVVSQMKIEERYLALGLISFADDDGRFLAGISAISGAVFPNDDLKPLRVRRWFDRLVELKWIHKYEVDGLQLACIPSWHEHQVIDRYTPSDLPKPDIECVPRRGRKTSGRGGGNQ